MIRRLPLVPTVLVLVAVAAMIALGVWQIGRAKQKEAQIALYQAAQTMPPISFPTAPLATEQLPLFRHATGLCLKPVGKRTRPGQNRNGEPGFLFIVDCSVGAEGPGMAVELGWSKNPNAAFAWPGGLVSGIIGPDKVARMRLVAATAPVGLEPSAPPSLDQIPNNSGSYAVQWFLFALTALVIYALALRKHLAPELPEPPERPAP